MLLTSISQYFIPRESSNIAWSIATAGYDRNENPNNYIDQAFEIICKSGKYGILVN